MGNNCSCESRGEEESSSKPPLETSQLQSQSDEYRNNVSRPQQEDVKASQHEDDDDDAAADDRVPTTSMEAATEQDAEKALTPVEEAAQQDINEAFTPADQSTKSDDDQVSTPVEEAVQQDMSDQTTLENKNQVTSDQTSATGVEPKSIPPLLFPTGTWLDLFKIITYMKNISTSPSHKHFLDNISEQSKSSKEKLDAALNVWKEMLTKLSQVKGTENLFQIIFGENPKFLYVNQGNGLFTRIVISNLQSKLHDYLTPYKSSIKESKDKKLNQARELFISTLEPLLKKKIEDNILNELKNPELFKDINEREFVIYCVEKWNDWLKPKNSSPVIFDVHALAAKQSEENLKAIQELPNSQSNANVNVVGDAIKATMVDAVIGGKRKRKCRRILLKIRT